MDTQRLWLLGLMLFSLVSCQVSDELPTTGSIDFSSCIAIGNSYVAGFTDGGLCRESQQCSFPNIFTNQVQKIGVNISFKQALFEIGQENGIGFYVWSGNDRQGKPQLTWVSNKLAIRSYNPILYTKATSLPNNLGVPNIRMSDITNVNYGTSAGNPLFERILPSNSSSKTYLDAIGESKPTFVMGGTKPITDISTYQRNTQALFAKLNGTKGVVMTIPDLLTNSPFFTHIKASSLSGKLNSPIYFRTGTGAIRKATDRDLILMSADSVGISNRSGLPKGYMYAYPLNNEDVLDEDEVAKVNQARLAFNSTLETEARAIKMVVINTNILFAKVKNGFEDNGISINANYPAGNFYSLDGIHLTAKGNALLANEIIKTLNITCQTALPIVNTANYTGMKKME
jgi:hypothetical protein